MPAKEKYFGLVKLESSAELVAGPYIPRFVPLQAEQLLEASVVPIQDATQFGSGDSILFGGARRWVRGRRR